MSVFRAGFTSYTVAMYQSWETTFSEINQPADQIFRYITSEVNQDAVLVWEYESERHKPPTCTNPNYYINVYIGTKG